MDKILVLNGDYSPISITTFKRAFKLAFKGKAEVINHEKYLSLNIDDDYYIQLLDQCPTLLSDNGFKIPTVIRLLKRIKIPYKKVPLIRNNIYRRDNNCCVYCGSNRKLTLDHVIPKSKGGPNTWTNLVTCCSSCNVKKGDKSLKEMGFKMKTKPYKPNHIQFINKAYGINIKDEWKQYLFY